ncbi:uncharacterized protein LOC131881183 [Tigriopus californicus]|uniref:uncharacterized protein LOC131881183 n=1 Tax=Tigriopus californicus TaxID=6832 RepID=UPI0027D9D96E|nr:uncharacterized protein LOC131881183 [Tigriopus californicus]
MHHPQQVHPQNSQHGQPSQQPARQGQVAPHLIPPELKQMMEHLSGSEARAAAKAADVVVELLLDPNAMERQARMEAAAECAKRAAQSARAAHEVCPTFQSGINKQCSEDSARTAERAVATL